MLIKVHIQPGAKKNEIAGRHGDAIKIRLKAPPVDGKANDELKGFLAQALGVKRSDNEIRSGLASRQKIVSVEGHHDPLSRLLDPST